MPLLTWQNVQVPSIGDTNQQGIRTAADMLKSAVGGAVSGVDRLQGMQDQRDAAQVAVADKFVLQKMLAAKDPAAYAQSLQDGSLVGPAADKVSAAMLGQLDARKDVLQHRTDADYARNRSMTRDQELKAAETVWDQAAKQAIYNPQAAQETLAQAKFSNAEDSAAFSERARKLFIDTSAHAAAKSAAKKDARDTWLDKEVGYLKRLAPNSSEFEKALFAHKDEDIPEIVARLNKITTPGLETRTDTPEAVAGTGGGSGSGGKSGTGTGNAELGASEIISKAIQAKIDAQKATPDYQLASEAKKYENKTGAEINKSLGAALGTDDVRAGQLIAKFMAQNPEATVAQAAAIIAHPGTVGHESIDDWHINVFKAIAGDSDAVNRPWEVGNGDYKADIAKKLADGFKTSKVFEGVVGLEKQQAELQKNLNLVKDLQAKIRSSENRRVDASDYKEQVQKALAKVLKIQEDYGGIAGTPTAVAAASAPTSSEEVVSSYDQSVPPPPAPVPSTLTLEGLRGSRMFDSPAPPLSLDGEPQVEMRLDPVTGRMRPVLFVRRGGGR